MASLERSVDHAEVPELWERRWTGQGKWAGQWEEQAEPLPPHVTSPVTWQALRSLALSNALPVTEHHGAQSCYKRRREVCGLGGPSALWSDSVCFFWGSNISIFTPGT